MIAAELVVLFVILAAGVLSIRKVEKTFTARLATQDAEDAARRVALYKQQKATQKTVAQSDRAVRKLADETRHLHEETRLAHERTDALARDVKQKLGG